MQTAATSDTRGVHEPRDSGPAAGNPADAAYLAYRGRRHFALLDGIRCLSVLAVVWHHTNPGFDWFPASKVGYLGVDMFFVLSGFLIVTLLLRERSERGEFSLRDFYIRRALRILPLYYGILLALTLLFLTVAASSPSREPFFDLLPYYLSHTSNWITLSVVGLAATWSLAAEEQFYLVWPACERLLRGWRLAALLAVVIAANQLINFKLADPWIREWIGLGHADLSILQATFTPIALGVAVAHLLHEPRFFRVISGVLGGRWAPVRTGLLLVAACSYPGDMSGLPRLTVQVLMAAFLVSCVLHDRPAMAWMLTNPVARRIGAVSYGIYLLHIFGMHVATKLQGAIPVRLPLEHFLVTGFITYAAAEASFWCWERPFLRLKSRFTRVRSAERFGVVPLEAAVPAEASRAPSWNEVA